MAYSCVERGEGKGPNGETRCECEEREGGGERGGKEKCVKLCLLLLLHRNGRQTNFPFFFPA